MSLFTQVNTILQHGNLFKKLIYLIIHYSTSIHAIIYYIVVFLGANKLRIR